MQIEKHPPSSPRFDSGSCHHRRNPVWQQFGSRMEAKTAPLSQGQWAMMLVANETALMGCNGTSRAFAELLRREIGGRGNYGRTTVEATPDIDALELGTAAATSNAG